jgi:replication factor C small subunit
MRKAINALQGAAILTPHITDKKLYEITAHARPKEIEGLLKEALAGDFERAEAALTELLDERGIAPLELLHQIYRAILDRQMDRALKVRLISRMGEVDFRISEGADSEIQMEALMAEFVLAALSSGKEG